jgi:hypothetical protein
MAGELTLDGADVFAPDTPELDVSPIFLFSPSISKPLPIVTMTRISDLNVGFQGPQLLAAVSRLQDNLFSELLHVPQKLTPLFSAIEYLRFFPSRQPVRTLSPV